MTTVPARPIRLGVQIAPQHATYPKIRETAAELEQLGVDVLFNWDHFYPLSGEPNGLHFESSYDEYGYEFGTVGQRLDALAENLPIIHERWTVLNPPPTRKIPVLIGGGGEKKTLRIVAKHADIWHSFSDPATMKRKLAILAEHGAAVGRDVSEIEISSELHERTPEQADELVALGATLFTLGLSGPDYDLTSTREWLAWRDAHNG
jgi:alkanesulfonate monooxygenase SsuD/methylene tetrahydromethanopterin reductase-like flavin-dependent oxidoreductase (luciferase family)